MDYSDTVQRSVRRHTGAADFDRWLTSFDADDLEELWLETGEPRLMAAVILTSLATPGAEGLRKLGDVTTDKRGQMQAYLDRAASLRAQVASERGLMGPLIQPWGVAGTTDPDRGWW